MTDEDKNEAFEQVMILLKAEDYGVALALLNPLAEEGHARSQTVLGMMYQEGTGVEKDLSKARYWLQKAADQGEDVQGNLFSVTLVLAFDLRVKDRDAEAFPLLKSLAENESYANMGPMFMVHKVLGEMYRDGEGVAKDLGKARYWLKKAADTGDPEARMELEELNRSSPSSSGGSSSEPQKKEYTYTDRVVICTRCNYKHEPGQMIFDNSYIRCKNCDGRAELDYSPSSQPSRKITFSDGSVYEGDFVNGMPNGKGKVTFASGDVYEGDFVEGKRHGYGKYTFKDGSVDEGRWENNNFLGSSPSSSPVRQIGGSSSSPSSSYDDDDSYSHSGSYGEPFGVILSIIISAVIAFISGTFLANFLYKFIPLNPEILNIGLVVAAFIVCMIICRSEKSGKIIKLAVVLIGISAIGIAGNKATAKITNNSESQSTQSATATVTADALNFRSGPGTSSDIIKAVTKGDTLIVTGDIENGWVPVTHDGDAGWVSAEMVSISTASSQSAGGTATVSQTPASFSDLIGTWKRNNYGNTLTFTANTLKSSSQDYTWDFVSASGGSFRIRSEYNSGTNINISLTNGNMIISGDSGSGEDNWNGTWVKQVPAGQTQSAAQQTQTTNSGQSATSSADSSGGIVEWARGRYPDNVVLNANSITNGRDINITGVRTDVQSPLSGHPNLKWAYIYVGDKKYGVVWDRTTYARSAHNGIELGMGSEARSAFDFYSGSDKDSIFADIAREAPGIKVVKQ